MLKDIFTNPQYEEKLQNIVSTFMNDLVRIPDKFKMFNTELMNQKIAEERERLKNEFESDLNYFVKDVIFNKEEAEEKLDKLKFPLKNSFKDRYQIEYLTGVNALSNKDLNIANFLKITADNKRNDLFYSVFELIGISNFPASVVMECESIYREFSELNGMTELEREIQAFKIVLNKAETYLRNFKTKDLDKFHSEADKEISIFLIGEFKGE